MDIGNKVKSKSTVIYYDRKVLNPKTVIDFFLIKIHIKGPIDKIVYTYKITFTCALGYADEIEPDATAKLGVDERDWKTDSEAVREFVDCVQKRTLYVHDWFDAKVNSQVVSLEST